MIVTIYENDDKWGSLEYFPDEKRVVVSYPDNAVKQMVIAYLTKVRTLGIQGDCRLDNNGPLTPTENLQYVDIALKQMGSHIGIHVFRGSPEEFRRGKIKVHTVKRTVPYNPSKSKEGLLISADGSIIYDDVWMHSDVLDEDERNSKGEK